VDLKKITSPVLNLAAEDDHIVLFKSTIQPYHLNKETQYDCFSVKGGHIGALLGSKAQKNIWPQIRDWILKQESFESKH
jgi:polyhydroxyalkanoate synthase